MCKGPGSKNNESLKKGPRKRTGQSKQAHRERRSLSWRSSFAGGTSGASGSSTRNEGSLGLKQGKGAVVRLGRRSPRAGLKGSLSINRLFGGTGGRRSFCSNEGARGRENAEKRAGGPEIRGARASWSAQSPMAGLLSRQQGKRIKCQGLPMSG